MGIRAPIAPPILAFDSKTIVARDMLIPLCLGFYKTARQWKTKDLTSKKIDKFFYEANLPSLKSFEFLKTMMTQIVSN
jgi:hypothetical protein